MFLALPLLAAEIDPPGRVGRISLANEGAQLRIGDSVSGGDAALNWPLTTGALIETANEARAEAQIGSTTLRIDGGTSLELAELSDERIWLRLRRGSVILDIRSPQHAAETVLDAPQGRLRFDAPGSYRADVAGGTSAFSAYSGAAHVEDFALTVRPGDRILLLGGAERSYVLGRTVADAFGQWSFGREQLFAGSGNHYVSPEMTGHEELDRHGIWRETPEYGAAWYPQGMPTGWAPYRWGRWAWVHPWGWTWIDQAPWGFAPFHYGRWALIGGQWAWLPGTYVTRPVYAPALVAWLAQPGRPLSFSLSVTPAVGWYPLGPREVYYPHYRSSLRHVRNINATHVSQITRIVTTAPPAADYERHHIHRHRYEAVTVAPQRPVQSWGETAPMPKPDFRRHPVSVAPAGAASAAPRAQVAPNVTTPLPRHIEAPKPKPAPVMPTSHPQRAVAAYAAPPGAVVSPPAPQRQPRFEAARDPAPRMAPLQHHHALEKKRETDRGEQARPKRGPPDR